MPEGHTIHRIARDHRRMLAGAAVSVRSPQGRFSDGAARLDGLTLQGVEAYGKHLFYRWEDTSQLHVHLGLFGKFRVHAGPEPPTPTESVRLRIQGPEVSVDLTGPTICSLGNQSDRDRVVARLGPDPLRSGADPERFYRRIGRSSAPIGGLLLNQSVISGVGNVFRAEALFVCGIDPERPGKELSQGARHLLWHTIVLMLKAGVKANRIVTVDRAELGLSRSERHRKDERTYAYKRQDCLRCGSPIRWFELASRTCYACPECQN